MKAINAIKTFVSQLALPGIFRSKRFWSAMLGLIFMIIVDAIPSLADSVEMLQQSTLIFVGLLIGGYSLEDTASAQSGVSKYRADMVVEDISIAHEAEKKSI